MGLDQDLQPEIVKLRSAEWRYNPLDTSCFYCHVAEMNAAAASTPEGSKAAPPKFKQKETRQFKSKAPKAGQKG